MHRIWIEYNDDDDMYNMHTLGCYNGAKAKRRRRRTKV